jgi:NodT family efflux transporter outer membrane factor (OMF) lipoprotein
MSDERQPRREQGSDVGAMSRAALTAIAALVASAVLLLAGCASTGGIAPTRTLAATAAPGEAKDDTPWPTAKWWQAYGDPELDTLVETALGGQPGLGLAQARLRQAQAAVDASHAARAPQVAASADLTDQRYTENGLAPPPIAGSIRWNNNATLAASWELDLFGRQRAALDAALGQWRAAQADLQAARVLLAGNIVGGWFNLARLDEASEIAAQSLQQREQVLTLVRSRIAAGLDTTVELRQAEGLIAQSRVEVEAIDEAIVRTRHALAELSGQRPNALDTARPTLAALRDAALPASLPADLLGRRADLVAQRWRVEAALRDVDVARAQFYPNINLAAFVGLSSLGLDSFIAAGSRTFGIGPALRLPVFDGGRLRANLGARSAEVDAAIDSYDATLLRALREVADELDSLRLLVRQQQAQDDAGAAAEAAYALALQRYQAGLGNFLVVLNAESTVLAQRRAAVDLKARRLGADIALQRALGGGYEADAWPVSVAQAR